MKRQNLIILSLLALVAVFAIGALVYQSQQAEQIASVAEEKTDVFVPAHAMRLGDPAAKVVIVEFFDPACETCAQFAPVLKAMVEQSQGRVQLVERYAPFHPGSPAVVAVLEASRAQDRYWETLDILFSTQSEWASHHDPRPDKIWGFLAAGGLDAARLAEDMKDPAIEALIKKDLADAKSLGVTQTPEFFVNGKPLPTWGMRQLKDLVQSELAANYPG